MNSEEVLLWSRPRPSRKTDVYKRQTVEWVTTGMERPIPELVDLLLEAMPQRLQELLSDLGK